MTNGGESRGITGNITANHGEYRGIARNVDKLWEILQEIMGNVVEYRRESQGIVWNVGG